MSSAENSIVIQRPVEEVFAFVADGENDLRWRPGLLDVTRVSDTAYKQGVKGPFGRRVDADYEWTSVEPNRRLEFRTIAGPVRPTGRWDFAPAEDGSTRVTFRIDYEPRGLGRLMSPMVARNMRSEVAHLDDLKRVLEAG
jgi:uncharacterized membrane protein